MNEIYESDIDTIVVAISLPIFICRSTIVVDILCKIAFLCFF